MSAVLTRIDLPGIHHVASGKVREIYEVGDNLLIVCTDRLSAFDVVLPDGIPDKGRVLTQLSRFWFERLTGIIPHHLITTDASAFPAQLQPYRPLLHGRSMLVKRGKPLPIECVVRGYLAGSAWAEYRDTGTVCGRRLPKGMKQAQRLPEPIFTPATKAAAGHDENISEDHAAELVGEADIAWIRGVSIDIYNRAAALTPGSGIIIADTKFEFGRFDGGLMLIDEVLTPDSSRFWAAGEYKEGVSPPSFDKQFVRDYLTASGWNKTPPGPGLPAEVVAGTSARYREAYRRITGSPLE